jgi:hypothetical protein
MDNISKKIIKILFGNLLFITLLFAELKVGDSFPPLLLENQFSKTVEISKKGEFTLFISFEKDISIEIQEFLEKQNSDFLSKNSMIYISDVSSLPAFLVNLFVLPKLKKFDFEVALIYNENGINREEKRVTFIRLNDNNITELSYVDTTELEKIMVKPTSF